MILLSWRGKLCVMPPVTYLGARAPVQISALHLYFYALLVAWLGEVLGNFCVALASPSAAQPSLGCAHGMVSA